jgi:hypothetical protein
MALRVFLVLRCLAPPGTARRAGRPGGGLALRDAASGGVSLRRGMALIQPLGNWITASKAGVQRLPRPPGPAFGRSEDRLRPGARKAAACAQTG